MPEIASDAEWVETAPPTSAPLRPCGTLARQSAATTGYSPANKKSAGIPKKPSKR